MDELNVCRRDLDKMQIIGGVTSWRDDKERWTQLSVFYRQGYNRPIVATVEGMERLPDVRGEKRFKVFSFKAVCVGTIERALGWFDDSELTHTLRTQVLGWTPPEAKPPAPLGYKGVPRITDAIAWLWPQSEIVQMAGTIQRPLLMERHFDIGQRTVNNALREERDGEAKGAWVKPFIASLRFFDRDEWKAWLETISSLDVGATSTGDTVPAPISKGKQ